MSAAQDWTPQDEWVRAFGELLDRTTDSAGIERRRGDVGEALERGLITARAADVLLTAVRARRGELFASLRTRGDRFQSQRARRTAPGGRLPFPDADRRAS
jgi:hypothetical protein